MAIYVSAGDSKHFEPAPEGLWPAVCCDVVEKGQKINKWGNTQNMVQLRWQLGEDSAGVRDDDKPWLIVKSYNMSLNEKATLYKDLIRWRGKAFTAEELKRFDLETVLGAPCMVFVVQTAAEDGTVYANVDTIMPLAKGIGKPVVRDYVRQRDREPQATFQGDTPEGREMTAAFTETTQTTASPPQAMPASPALHDGASAPQPGNAEIAEELFGEGEEMDFAFFTEDELKRFATAHGCDTRKKVCARLGVAGWQDVANIGWGTAASRIADMQAAKD